ncbi:protein LURP-one-related 6 [Vigna radiata var. radiata]|uniref:Protein LURP-one-related 6 n=1 Tax=Vigna radiata var. radiata TaxID=3916 RepID=A0A1S3U3I0_VIGRR|nr:protein LURP-one-related 6 [Vigna radiata var. radiata]
MMPVISKMYCSSSQMVLGVRRRPHVVNGGGLVVTDCSAQRVVFKVDGCGIHGTKEQLILRDGEGDALLLMRRKGGMIEALSIYKKWKGYSMNYEGSRTLVFSLKEPNSCFVRNNGIRISIEPRAASNKGWDFEIRGYFPDRNCSIVDIRGNVIAQVGVNKEVEKLMETKDLYNVVVKPGMDQAFVFGVIAVLDYIYGESTYC